MGKRLPRTHTWQQVVAILDSGAPAGAVASATLDAAQEGLAKGESDPGFAHAVWLLAKIPLAAQHAELQQSLATLGLEVSEAPSLFEIASAASRGVDDTMRASGRRSDFGVMAKLALAESLINLAADRQSSLFDESAQSAGVSLASLSTKRNFGRLGREFFTNLIDRYLLFFISRELPAHSGRANRFQSPEEQTEFREALRLHCAQASKIVEEFSGGWHGKTNFETGISKGDASRFGAYALKKLSDELALRVSVNG